jgi:hypothetical protein
MSMEMFFSRFKKVRKVPCPRGVIDPDRESGGQRKSGSRRSIESGRWFFRVLRRSGKVPCPRDVCFRV